MAEINVRYDDLKSASKNLEIISQELDIVKNHLKSLKNNMSASFKGEASTKLLDDILPSGIEKSRRLSDKSRNLSILMKDYMEEMMNTENMIEHNIEDVDLDFL